MSFNKYILKLIIKYEIGTDRNTLSVGLPPGFTR